MKKTDSGNPNRSANPAPIVSRVEARKILGRQGGRCAAGGRRPGVYCEEVDFIVPLDQGGERTARTMQVLCPPCHRIKAGKDRALAGNRRDER
ncbi:MAG: HNH endonuclease [Methanomicrobiaceae archaeon]|nr:HNH endonuclease [Methanomicrobiaceae archaeon]